MIDLIRRIFFCIDYSIKKKLINIQLLSIFSSIITVIATLSIAPFLAILINKEFLFEIKWIKPFLNKFDSNDLTIYFAAFLILFYCISIIANVVVEYFNLKWSNELSIYFRVKLYNHFMGKNIIFHVNNSSKLLLSKIHHDTERLKGSLIDPALELITNLFLTIFILVTVIVVNYEIALILLIFFLFFYFLFYSFLKKKMRAVGDMVTKSYPIYHKIIFESFSSIRDTILFNKKYFFINRFQEITKEMSDALTKQLFILKLPRNIIEIFLFIIMILILIYLIKFQNFKFEQLGPKIAFYGICVIKLLPAFQKIFNSYATIKSHTSAFENIENDLLEAKNCDLKKFAEDKNLNGEFNFKNCVELKNISFNYPGKRKKGLSNISLKFKFGQKIGIVGKTGSGKSTLIDILCGLIKSDEGDFFVDGTRLDENNIIKWQKKISLVPQKFFISEGNLKTNIAFGSLMHNIDENKVRECLKASCLEEFIDNLNLELGENGERISGGQSQRVAISRSLYKNSELLILDEATSSLDTITEKKIFKNIQSYNDIRTLIIVTHRIETLQECDILFYIDDGTLKELKNYDELLDIYNNKLKII